MLDIEALRERLEAERQRLRREVEGVEADLAKSLEGYSDEGPYDQHMAEMASATFEREMSLTLHENARSTLARVERALAKMDEGTYGLCDRCGGLIGEGRLEAVPFATLCVECKREEERTR